MALLILWAPVCASSSRLNQILVGTAVVNTAGRPPVSFGSSQENGDLIRFNGVQPSGNLLHDWLENHHLQWEDSLFQGAIFYGQVKLQVIFLARKLRSVRGFSSQPSLMTPEGITAEGGISIFVFFFPARNMGLGGATNISNATDQWISWLKSPG